MSALIMNSFASSTDYKVTDDILIPNTAKQFSIEYFFLINYSGASRGTAILFAPTSKGCGCDPYGWGNFCGSLSGISDLTPYNGTYIFGSGSEGYFRFPITLHTQLIHMAYVLDTETSIVKIYINGIIYCSYKFNAGIEHKARPYMNPRNGWTCAMTQLAIFSYDKSTNNGMNYPVPTEPYIQQ